MDEDSPATALDSTHFRRAGITAFFYAVIDVLIVFIGGPFVLFRLIGIVAAYFVVRDMMVLREAGIEWGWTRYLILVFVAVGGFLGFFVYAWRRHQHVEAHTWDDAAAEAEDSDTAAEDPLTEDSDTAVEDTLAEDSDTAVEDTLAEDGDTAAEDPIAEDADPTPDDPLAEDTSNTTE